MKFRNLLLNFLPLWIFVNAIGWSAYPLLSFIRFRVLGISLGAALFIGFLQWIVLKRYVGIDSSWIWPSMIMYGVILAFLRYFPGEPISWYFLPLMFVLGIFGFLQRSILDYYVDNSIIWVFVNLMVGVLGIYFASIIPPFIYFVASFSWTIFGIFYGLCTGIAIVFMYASTATPLEVTDS